MVRQAAFLLVPLVALAQAPPPEVDEALRARVKEFLQYHVDHAFRKAEALVASDTKDWYFENNKTPLKWFRIDSIDYNDNFTKARVHAVGDRILFMHGSEGQGVVQMDATLPMDMTWKIEDGKWFWYLDPSTLGGTPMGPPPPRPADGTKIAPPRDMSPAAIAEAGRNIIAQMGTGVDKSNVTLDPAKTSSDQVVLRNGTPGWVQLSVFAPTVPGFTAALDKTQVKAGDTAVLKLRYDPAGASGVDIKGPINVRLAVDPIGLEFPITVKLEPPSK